MKRQLDAMYPGLAPSAGFIGKKLKELELNKTHGRSGKRYEYYPWRELVLSGVTPVPFRQSSRFMLLMNFINKEIDDMGLTSIAAQWADRLDFVGSSMDDILKWLVIDQYAKRTSWVIYDPIPGVVDPTLTEDLDMFLALAPWENDTAKKLYAQMVESGRANLMMFERLMLPAVNGRPPTTAKYKKKTDFAIWANRALGLPYDLIIEASRVVDFNVPAPPDWDAALDQPWPQSVNKPVYTSIKFVKRETDHYGWREVLLNYELSELLSWGNRNEVMEVMEDKNVG